MEKLRYECQGHKISIFKNVEKQEFSATVETSFYFTYHKIHFAIDELIPSNSENNSSNQP